MELIKLSGADIIVTSGNSNTGSDTETPEGTIPLSAPLRSSSRPGGAKGDSSWQ